MCLFSKFLVFALLGSLSATAQSYPFDSDSWEVTADSSRVVDYLGQKALYLKGGYAVVRNSDLSDGVVEFDIAVSGDRGFSGGIWRVQDLGNFEQFYIRPHQSGNPDANQYTPVFNGDAGWQLYYGDAYSAPVKYRFDQWMHIKVIVSGSQADIYVIDMQKPAVQVRDLKRNAKAGRVGLSVGNFSPAYFANFSVTKGKFTLTDSSSREVAMPAGTVRSWQISSAFAESKLTEKTILDEADKKALMWTKLESERTGITNLSRIQGPAKDKNTAFARVDIESDRVQTVMMRFGYSDRVRVYCNDQLLYVGSNNYLSRDYRYLGTIGLFDAVALPLKKGRNRVWFAVAEDFGGWGIWGVLDSVSSARVIE